MFTQKQFVEAYQDMHPGSDAEYAEALYDALDKLREDPLLDSLVEATFEEVYEIEKL